MSIESLRQQVHTSTIYTMPTAWQLSTASSRPPLSERKALIPVSEQVDWALSEAERLAGLAIAHQMEPRIKLVEAHDVIIKPHLHLGKPRQQTTYTEITSGWPLHKPTPAHHTASTLTRNLLVSRAGNLIWTYGRPVAIDNDPTPAIATTHAACAPLTQESFGLWDKATDGPNPLRIERVIELLADFQQSKPQLT